MASSSAERSLASQVRKIGSKKHEIDTDFLDHLCLQPLFKNDKVMRAGEAMEAGLRECCRFVLGLGNSKQAETDVCIITGLFG